MRGGSRISPRFREGHPGYKLPFLSLVESLAAMSRLSGALDLAQHGGRISEGD
jgi:hypothetical protein